MAAEIAQSQEISYAMIGALHARMNRTNLGNIYKYINRAFSKELQVVFHFDIIKFQKSLIKHEAYVKFCSDNGDLLSN
ncbi:MAG: hypothetical protein JRE23_03180, partial [Deltaproteobacteria bacterium]|nr:hypothetical protein [Deltaproteobacteria bacterium]